jgi:hypothetical protein
MKRFTIATGICAVLLIATIFVAGCTSSSNASPTDTGASPQNTQAIAPTQAGSGISPQLTQTTVPAPVSDQGTQVDSTSNAGTDAATVNADASIDPYTSTSQSTTMVPDGADLGDPIP